MNQGYLAMFPMAMVLPPRLVCALALAASVMGALPSRADVPRPNVPATAKDGKVRRVLILYATGRLIPGVVEFDEGFGERSLETSERHVEIYGEFLDSARFNGPDHDEVVSDYLQRKYRTLPPDVVVAAGVEALHFVLRHRARLPKGVPVVHAALNDEDLAKVAPLPPRFVGVPSRDEFIRTARQALLWHPEATRVVVVVGSKVERDRLWGDRVRREAPLLGTRATLEILEDVPMPALKARLAQLGPESVVFTAGFAIDAEGRSLAPRDAVAAVAAATRVPVYASGTTHMGTGIVGGWLLDYRSQGRTAAGAVARLLDGIAPEALGLPASIPLAMHVDWRQLRRFGIDERTLPAGTVVHFREPSLWQAYRNTVLGALVVMTLQALLIGGLLFERRRRHQAELSVTSARTELAHASRLAVAGQLAAAVAHEINQPLGAILSNADAASMVLDSGTVNTDLLRQILVDIRRDDVRASEVIRRLRRLLQKHEVERAPFVLNDAVREVELVLRAEARRRHVSLSVLPSEFAGTLLGDRTHIQQVLINLVLNAMEAVSDLPEPRRIVTVGVQARGNSVSVAVSDRGPGIAPEHLRKVFDSFFTTKPTGMGLGLSIARTIVAAHGGTIRAENGAGGGAVFVMDLPLTIAVNSPDGALPGL